MKYYMNVINETKTMTKDSMIIININIKFKRKQFKKNDKFKKYKRDIKIINK